MDLAIGGQTVCLDDKPAAIRLPNRIYSGLRIHPIDGCRIQERDAEEDGLGCALGGDCMAKLRQALLILGKHLVNHLFNFGQREHGRGQRVAGDCLEDQVGISS